MKKIKLITTVVLLLVCGAVFACSKLGGSQTKLIEHSGGAEIVSEMPEGTENEVAPAVTDAASSYPDKIFVHVCGAVKHPDVYEVDASSRVIDAVKLAGGFTEAAAGDYLNLAGELADGSRIYVPTFDEIESGEYPAAAWSGLAEGINGVSSVIQDDSGKVNINTADADKLKTLNGIGDSRAGDIINYREKNGAFKTIEDIKNVPGIKDSVFSKICDDIEV